MIEQKAIEKILNLAIEEITDVRGLGKDIYQTVSSSDVFLEKETKKYRTIFLPAMVLLNLAECKRKKILTLKEKITDFLLREKNQNWSYNYWASDAPEKKTILLPDDLDDTFVSLEALQTNGYQFTARDYAKITNLLVVAEDKTGGPYRTWLVGEEVADKRWLEVDVAVNANIAYFLQLNEINLPNLKKYFSKKISDDKLQSLYYPDWLVTVYYLSRLVKGNDRDRLSKILLEREERINTKNSLRLALWLGALLNLGQKGTVIDRGIKKLILNYEQGGWKWNGFCLDPMVGKKKYYNGSVVLTYSFCIKVLEQYCQINSLKQKDRSKSKRKQNEFADYVEQVFGRAQDRLKETPIVLKEAAKDFLNKYRKKDEDGEIILLPWVMARSPERVENRKLLENLSLASLYGWMSYTIYDDFLDDEGEKKLLPLANLWLRELVKIYDSLELAGLDEYFEQLMDEMEGANLWEVTNCRWSVKEKLVRNKLPKFGQGDVLASKSIGHALAGVAILLNQGVSKKIVQKYLSAFRKYLITRQLNDDAHDWEEDLKRGQINMAGAMVIEDYWQSTNKKQILIKEDLEKIQLVFWQKTIKKISRKIEQESELAKKQISDLSEYLELGFLSKKLDNLQSAAIRAVKESQETQDFIGEISK